MKRVLILTVTAGNGHNACAYGMKAKLEELEDCEVKIIDILKSYSSKRCVWTTDNGYCISVSRFLPLYNAFYKKYYKLPAYKRYSTPSQSTVLTVTDGLLKEILDFKPDVVYATHFYGAIAMTDLKLVYNLPCKTVVTCLDYYNSPFWESGIGVDYFNIPDNCFADEFLREGFRQEQLITYGIPVDARTLEEIDKKEARKSLGLDTDLFTVTVIYGGGYWSGGFKIFKGIIKALKGRKAQVIMINGKNKKSFKKIERMKFGDGLKVKNIGFTNDVPLYFSAADVAVSKSGGLCTTEMVNKSLPMLITEKLAEQEKHNLDYMKKNGVALSFKNGKTIKEQILKLMDDENLRNKMSENCAPLRKPATEALAEFILKLPSADYSELAGINCKGTKKAIKAALKAADKKERAKARKNSR